MSYWEKVLLFFHHKVHQEGTKVTKLINNFILSVLCACFVIFVVNFLMTKILKGCIDGIF